MTTITALTKMTSPSDPGISLDFTPEVEMVLELHKQFPAINGANRPVALDRCLNELFKLIECKADKQVELLLTAKAPI